MRLRGKEPVESCYTIAIANIYYYFNDCLVFVRQTIILGSAHKYVLANGLDVNRYTCVYLFMAYIITPLKVIWFCAESFMLLLFLYSVVLLLAFTIQYIGL